MVFRKKSNVNSVFQNVVVQKSEEKHPENTLKPVQRISQNFMDNLGKLEEIYVYTDGSCFQNGKKCSWRYWNLYTLFR